MSIEDEAYTDKVLSGLQRDSLVNLVKYHVKNSKKLSKERDFFLNCSVLLGIVCFIFVGTEFSRFFL